MLSFKLSITAAIVAALALFTYTEACERGLSWGTEDILGTKMGKGYVSWYWHWQDAANKYLDQRGLEFVPCFWGPKYQDKWNQRKKEMAHDLPKHILAFNEPEIPGQANMGPKHAARLFMQEIQPYAKKGVKLSSPQMVYKLDWLETFMDECDKLGCQIDFMALHWYGTHKDLTAFKKWISSVHKRFNRPIWVTEYGITSAAGASQQDIKNFHMKATTWMEQTGYVQRASWLGCFKVNSPPDSYASNKNAFFNGNGSLRDLAYWYIYTSGSNSKRDTIPHHRHQRSLPGMVHVPRSGVVHTDLDGATIIDDEDTFEPYQDIVECDDYCQLRKASIEKFEAKYGRLVDEEADDDEEATKA
ncbi:uncharacterized protein PFL1_06664 [Pseudozyma flocculosa PF-1]|uniref:Asl1-like glycosyl hydrolase catalytic domain-containing protein n=2 Tax=Pseudozyma flocculosa TaxID=84751 RepID=A0A5C3F7U0_9BASI|nr:uncharacterized protein PFL1_06664 [Pseudozyma flocculosa PF-1]EPQ25797.1 hypothetical protein PFL1_06664 [Pseudozyma flocculosa PF-1]SPO40503.1 uncharacterized protein PSFLO_05985 [Pseudozyma flocculosa]